MSTIKRTVRRSQTVVPFGPGAIYDFGNESLLAIDTSRWPAENCRSIRLPRLEEQLSVNEFKEAPVADGNGAAQRNFSVPFMRFPEWLFCPNCDRMFRWSDQLERPGEAPTCRHCSSHSKLAPMRFIAVCSDGHLMEVDWGRLAHSLNNGNFRCDKDGKQLEFRSKPTEGGGLRSLSVHCSHCNAHRNFENLCNPDFLKVIGKGTCTGRHPWQNVESSEPCDKTPKVIQRGESNAYFADTVSALDISDDSASDGDELSAKIRSHSYFHTLQQLHAVMPDSLPTNVAIANFLGQVAAGVGCTVEVVWRCVVGQTVPATVPGNGTQEADIERLKAEEWTAFQRAQPSVTGRNFVTQRVDFTNVEESLPSEDMPAWRQFRELIKSVVLARRIRIVKALTGFRRLEPEGRKVPPHLTGSLGWLPASEIFGEGIFLEFDRNALDTWLARNSDSAIAPMVERQKKSSLGSRFPEATLRGVVLHTFSHLLIRQLTFDCGYSSSSLAERIYCSDEMAGIFIYTGTADSEGSLGGLVREGELDRIYGIISTALFRGQWCSNDPICTEMLYQGVGGLNRAACHACTLLAETSCETANTLLDRRLIFGCHGVSGLFQRLVETMQDPV